ncbi:hypothetical protein [Pseudomonas baetica]|uniref:hypothetical protein n=1 Tax=Pseudomonas baetica TaxID=674054 RepID=UPI0024057A56|nr:hypothetical protein [Pseudomonas baetica]MDF9779143.1 hypothetical protein [Pseudomonas baetica]
MFNTTRTTRITINSLLVGILIGCTAVANLLVTKGPTPFVPIALAVNASLTPACIALAVISLFWKPLQRVIAPVLFFAGAAVPFDVAFACLLGMFDETVLQLVVGLLFVGASTLLAWIIGSERNRGTALLLSSGSTERPTPSTSGVTQ